MALQSGGVFAGSPFGLVASAVFGSLLVAACVSDLRTRRIPNWLVLALAGTGVVYSITAAPVLAGLGSAIAGLGVGLVIWFPFYLLRMLGAGDVKFFAAACAWLGAGLGLRAALLSALVGGLLGAVWVILGVGFRRGITAIALDVRAPRLRMTSAILPERHASRLPYGVAMAVGLAVAAWFPHFLS